MKEIFKTIELYPDYEISSVGDVRSKERIVKRLGKDKKVRERILKPAKTMNGYLFVCLRKNNRHHNVRIHQLVAKYFVEGYQKGLVVHHKYNNKLNNNASNLEYVSMQKNTQEYFKTIGKSSGSIPISHILTIIEKVNNGHKCIDIAKEYGVTRNDISVLCKIVTDEELTIKQP